MKLMKSRREKTRLATSEKPKDNHDSRRLDLKQVFAHAVQQEEVFINCLARQFHVTGSIRSVNLFLFFHPRRQKAVATGCLERSAKPNDILGFGSTFPKYGQQILGLKNNTFILCHSGGEDMWGMVMIRSFINTENPQKHSR